MKKSAFYWALSITLAWTLSMLAACGTIPEPQAAGTLTAPTQQSLAASDTPLLPPTINAVVTTSVALPIVPAFRTPEPSPTPAPLRFAVIGDYGEGNQAEQDVADLVKSWNPELVITVGDNNYPSGSAGTIDDRVGRFYSGFIYPYTGAFGPGATENRFFPTLGNHDWDTPGAQPYLDYFTLPGNERYYDFVWGPVHFFAVDSDSREPDGVSQVSAQAQWLQARLAASTSPWKIVYFHHSPYSSGYHGPVDWMRWPFGEWGASVVLSGHDHTYERLLVDGLPYLVNGLGGGPIYYFINIEPGSQVRYNDDYGAMLVNADEATLSFQLFTRRGELVDQYQLGR